MGAATGAVGSVVRQIGKLMGLRGVGVAENCAYAVNRLGFDACVDHKAAALSAALKAAAPKGIDVYYENVGGAVLDASLPLMNTDGRISVCGLIAQYNTNGLLV